MLSRWLPIERFLLCTLTIEYHPTVYAPGEVRDDMSVPMAAIRRQPPAGRDGCSAFPIRTLLPLFCKKDTTRTFFSADREKCVEEGDEKNTVSKKTIANEMR